MRYLTARDGEPVRLRLPVDVPPQRAGLRARDLRLGVDPDAVAASRLYGEPKRLERLGYVSSEKRPGKTRERTFYTLTDRGREALRRWVLEPPALPRIQNEAVPKLLSGDILGDDEQLLASLLTLRDEIEGHQARLDEARQRLEGLPHRRSYLLLIQDLGDRLLQVQREWLDDVERESGPRTPPARNCSSDPSATAADAGDDFPIDRRSTRY